ncbi:MAG: AarF/UbiB family protein [Bifidobacterium adolescentis]
MIYRFCFGSIYRHGLFNGDPHPGNYLLLDEGGIGFVDYGCIAEFDTPTIEGFMRLIRALNVGDIEEWRVATEAIGILLPNAPFTTEELYEHMHWYWAPILGDRVRFTRELATEMVRRNTMTTGLGGQINRHCNVPAGMVFLTRINFGLAGLLAGLEAEGPVESHRAGIRRRRPAVHGTGGALRRNDAHGQPCLIERRRRTSRDAGASVARLIGAVRRSSSVVR